MNRLSSAYYPWYVGDDDNVDHLWEISPGSFDIGGDPGGA